jgi:phosphohistidine phosphatase SixA
VTVFLVRHGSAGKRSKWEGDDRLRPLDEKGRAQAQGLVALLGERGVERILTSPYVRCRETVEPLADALGLPVEERDELAEGASRQTALALVAELAGEPAVLCTHGDVVDELAGEETKKGSTLLLSSDGLRRLDYLPPPSKMVDREVWCRQGRP